MDRNAELPPPYKLIKARHGFMLANPNDFYVGRALCEYGEYGELELQLLSQLLFRHGAVVEVGANIGTHTVPLARMAAAQGRSIEVFEPQPVVFQNLCANLALSGIFSVRAWPWACGAEAGTVYFPPPDYFALGNFGRVSMTAEADAENGGVPVPCVRLQDAVQSRPVGLIKIDVEGMEIEVLKGAADLIAESRPVLYLENDRVEQSKELIEWLWAADYRLWWHVPPLFNQANFFGAEINLYGDIVSCNMLCMHREAEIPVNLLHEVKDADLHPMVAGKSPFA